MAKAWALVGCWLLAVATAAAEPIALVCRGFDAATAVRALEGSTGQPHRLGNDLSDRARKPLYFLLHAADADAARQALAHSLGCWVAGGSGVWTFTALPEVPLGTCQVLQITSTLANEPQAEVIARRLLAPWLHDAAGLAWQPGGVWTATLDEAGRARFLELVSLLDTGPVRIPSWSPEPQPAVPNGPVWAWALLRPESVALGPDLDAESPAPAACLARIRSGVLCLGLSSRDTGRHPAERRQLALLPVGHLCNSSNDYETLAQVVAPRIASLPGWGVAPLPWRRSLLVAADAAAIHAVLADLDRADRGGIGALLSRGGTAGQP